MTISALPRVAAPDSASPRDGARSGAGSDFRDIIEDTLAATRADRHDDRSAHAEAERDDPERRDQQDAMTSAPALPVAAHRPAPTDPGSVQRGTTDARPGTGADPAAVPGSTAPADVSRTGLPDVVTGVVTDESSAAALAADPASVDAPTPAKGAHAISAASPAGEPAATAEGAAASTDNTASTGSTESTGSTDSTGGTGGGGTSTAGATPAGAADGRSESWQELPAMTGCAPGHEAATTGQATREASADGASGPAVVAAAAPGGPPTIVDRGAVATSAGPAAPAAQQVVPVVTRLVGRGDGVHTMTLRLHPEELGEVRVTVTVRNSAVDVTLAAGPAAREALRDGSPQLRSLLDLAGANASSVVVRDLPTAAAAAGSGSNAFGTGPQGHSQHGQPGQAGQAGQAGQGQPGQGQGGQSQAGGGQATTGGSTGDGRASHGHGRPAPSPGATETSGDGRPITEGLHPRRGSGRATLDVRI